MGSGKTKFGVIVALPTYKSVVIDGAELDIAEARQWDQEQAGLGSTSSS